MNWPSLSKMFQTPATSRSADRHEERPLTVLADSLNRKSGRRAILTRRFHLGANHAPRRQETGRLDDGYFRILTVGPRLLQFSDFRGDDFGNERMTAMGLTGMRSIKKDHD